MFREIEFKVDRMKREYEAMNDKEKLESQNFEIVSWGFNFGEFNLELSICNNGNFKTITDRDVLVEQIYDTIISQDIGR